MLAQQNNAELNGRENDAGKAPDRFLPPNGTIMSRIRNQHVSLPPAESSSVFYRNLEKALMVRRDSTGVFSIVENNWQTEGIVDFCSNDLLSFNATGDLRREFLAELEQNPGFTPGSGGSRLLDGNYSYLEHLERDASIFHGYEAGLVLGSGYDANMAIWTALPRSGDVIVYDAAVHTSIQDGVNQSLAARKIEFRHNDIESFKEVLQSIRSAMPQIKQGRNTILVAVESVYGVDGDTCPLAELIEIAKQVYPENHGNVQFVVDEAHSTGMMGPEGAGFVCELGLQHEVAVVMHSFAKALGSIGAIVVGSKTVVSMLINYARCFIFTTAPPFPFIASVRAGYRLLRGPVGTQSRLKIQLLAQTLFETLTSHPGWANAQSKGLLRVPLAEDWESRPIFTHVVGIFTQPKHTFWLYAHLLHSSYCTFPVQHPVVPMGQSRIKVTMHAGNTTAEIQGLVESIFDWVTEVEQMESEGAGSRATRAAALLYEQMKREGVVGFGSAM